MCDYLKLIPTHLLFRTVAIIGSNYTGYTSSNLFLILSSEDDTLCTKRDQYIYIIIYFILISTFFLFLSFISKTCNKLDDLLFLLYDSLTFLYIFILYYSFLLFFLICPASRDRLVIQIPPCLENSFKLVAKSRRL